MPATGRDERRCAECGAPLPADGTCADTFHALLALEWQLQGEADGPGGLAHFFLVSSYVLQHPTTMNYSAPTLAGLRVSVADALAGRANIPELRRRSRDGATRAGRITIRGDEQPVRWTVKEWSMTAGDVLEAGIDVYLERVRQWARSICDTLDAAEGQSVAALSLRR